MFAVSWYRLILEKIVFLILTTAVPPSYLCHYLNMDFHNKHMRRGCNNQIAVSNKGSNLQKKQCCQTRVHSEGLSTLAANFCLQTSGSTRENIHI